MHCTWSSRRTFVGSCEVSELAPVVLAWITSRWQVRYPKLRRGRTVEVRAEQDERQLSTSTDSILNIRNIVEERNCTYAIATSSFQTIVRTGDAVIFHTSFVRPERELA